MRCVIPGRSVKCESLKARFDRPLFAFLSFFPFLFSVCQSHPLFVQDW